MVFPGPSLLSVILSCVQLRGVGKARFDCDSTIAQNFRDTSGNFLRTLVVNLKARQRKERETIKKMVSKRVTAPTFCCFAGQNNTRSHLSAY